jgi:hypothetical protein
MMPRDVANSEIVDASNSVSAASITVANDAAVRPQPVSSS